VNDNDSGVNRAVFHEYPDILDIRQTSVLLGVSTKTVYKIIACGSLPAIKVGREFRIPKTNLMRYIKMLEGY